MNLLYFIEAIKEVVNANSPDNAVASPYEGIRNGRRVIIKIPKPNPVVLWMKLAPTANRNISNIFSANNCESIILSGVIQAKIQKLCLSIYKIFNSHILRIPIFCHIKLVRRHFQSVTWSILPDGLITVCTLPTTSSVIHSSLAT